MKSTVLYMITLTFFAGTSAMEHKLLSQGERIITQSTMRTLLQEEVELLEATLAQIVEDQAPQSQIETIQRNLARAQKDLKESVGQEEITQKNLVSSIDVNEGQSLEEKSALFALAGIGNSDSSDAPSSGAVPAIEARPPEENQGTLLDRAQAETIILYKEACVLRKEKKYSEAIVQFESLVKRAKVLDVPIMAWIYLADCYNLSMPKTPQTDARRIECMHRFLNLTRGLSSAVKNKETSAEKKESSIINNNNT